MDRAEHRGASAMKQLLATLQLRWRIARAWVALGRCPLRSDHWLPEDHHALRTFLATPTGRRLSQLMAHQEQVCNAWAVEQTSNFQNHNGYARGFRAALAMVWGLSAELPPQAELSPDADAGAASTDESLRAV